ncbi:MAG: diaminopimelate decarboxylase [Pseudomonadota bacterium]|nr:diaminopimelate decarboxylase [Pseudomonadota bacterium]
MSTCHYREGALHIEDVALSAIAQRFGTPCYIYSKAALEASYREYDSALKAHPHLVCYALKANSNLAVLDVFARMGSGFDIVSGGELARVLRAGGDAAKVVFSGVGKTVAEMEQALEARILCFNVESAAELHILDSVARAKGVKAPVSIRINPDVDPRTHPYIATGLSESKFGVPFQDAAELYRHAATLPNLAVRGIDLHIGSQITDLAPFHDAIAKTFELIEVLRSHGIALDHVDVGGGLGIRYRDEQPVPLTDYAAMLMKLFAGRPERLLVEPGRRLVGDAGVLLTRVLYLKPGAKRSFAVVDGAMNDLIRPALYGAWHPVSPVRPRDGATINWQIVGPVCESGDFLAADREIALVEGDLLAIGATGAYGFVMSSNYNTRARACEVMVSRSTAHEVRARETVESLFANESLLP